MGRLNERSIRDLLQALYDALLEGRVLAVPWPDESRHHHTGPWRGLHDVVFRYDCVTFWLTKERSVEARVSRLPQEEADLVRRIWMFTDPDLFEAEAIATVVKHHPALPPAPEEIPRAALIARTEERLAAILARPLMYGGDWHGVEITVLDALDSLDLLASWPHDPRGDVMDRWVAACRAVRPDVSDQNTTPLLTLQQEGAPRDVLIAVLRQAVAAFRTSP